MDILIKNMNLVKNMEMPEGCASCPLLNCYSLCPFLIKYVNTIDYRIKRLPNCPLREIDIIYCKDCKHHWIHKCMDSMPIERCDLGQTFYDAEVDYCSLAERREVNNEGN